MSFLMRAVAGVLGPVGAASGWCGSLSIVPCLPEVVSAMVHG